eukprot:1371474-Rhodomonas_salina.1
MCCPLSSYVLSYVVFGIWLCAVRYQPIQCPVHADAAPMRCPVSVCAAPMPCPVPAQALSGTCLRSPYGLSGTERRCGGTRGSGDDAPGQQKPRC